MLENIIEGRQGTVRTNLSGAAAYASFKPAPLPAVLPIQLPPTSMRLLTTCSRKIGELAGMAQFVPNADMYLTMYVRKEALLSSQIEGTQCTFDDVLDPSASYVHEDVADVVHYVEASKLAVSLMETMPLSLHLLRRVHAVLIGEGRGADKCPGEVRSSQNWIGPGGCTIKTAPYVPPNVEDMKDALYDLDSFINCEVDLDPLVKAALIHYQFETIHPFLDGNGRLGRLLITLSLMNDGVLEAPLFYPSYRLKLKRRDYYEHLTAVRERGAFEEWVSFFCECMLESAEDATRSLRKLVELHNSSASKIEAHFARGASAALSLLKLLEAHPIVGVNDVRDGLGISRSSAANLVSEFASLRILSLRDEKKRYRTYIYEPYLSILRDGVEPLSK